MGCCNLRLSDSVMLHVAGNIRVFCRVRPLTTTEEQVRKEILHCSCALATYSCPLAWLQESAEDEGAVMSVPTEEILTVNSGSSTSSLFKGTTHFEFDRVFSPKSTQQVCVPPCHCVFPAIWQCFIHRFVDSDRRRCSRTSLLLCSPALTGTMSAFLRTAKRGRARRIRWKERRATSGSTIGHWNDFSRAPAPQHPGLQSFCLSHVSPAVYLHCFCAKKQCRRVPMGVQGARQCRGDLPGLCVDHHRTEHILLMHHRVPPHRSQCGTFSMRITIRRGQNGERRATYEGPFWLSVLLFTCSHRHFSL